MAFKRRIVAVLFVSALVVGMVWSCLVVVQTDRLSESDDVNGHSLPVATSVQPRHSAPSRPYLERRLERRVVDPKSNEFTGERSPKYAPYVYDPEETTEKRDRGGAEEGTYRYYLESNNVPKAVNGKKTLQALYNRLETSPPQALERKTEAASRQQTHSLSSILSDPDMLQLLRGKKQAEMRLENDARELWWYLRAQLNKLKTMVERKDVVEGVLVEVEERYDTLTSQLQKTEDASNKLLWPGWKEEVSTSLGDLMQRRLRYLQNPANCSQAKRMVCNVAKTCGFGCQVHHIAYCFILAYATERMLVINSRGWQYSDHGWESVFLPLSSTCSREHSGIYVHRH